MLNNKVKSLPKGLNVFVTPTITTFRLYSTDIVKFNHFTNQIILNVDSWFTRHSLKCINLALKDTYYQVYQKKGNWYIELNSPKNQIKAIPYKNNISLPIGEHI